MNTIKVFYHVYIPPDMRACAWCWYVDQQLQLIRLSKLHQVAQIHMRVTMPVWWTDLFGSPFLHHTHHTPITFGDKLKEYVTLRYAWVHEIQLLDISENVFEGTTLKHMHDISQHEQFLALYIHTKGVIPQASPSIANWREVLNHFMITEWPHNVKLLETHDVVAVNDQLSSHSPVVSGNFFWARSDYIKTLADPLQPEQYTHNTDVWPSGANYRYAFELWILSREPRVHYCVNTQVNHYGEYCFLEDLVRKH